jgi:hypothetical protein
MLLTTKQVCEKYGVTRECVRLWRLKGLDFIYRGPRKLYYDARVVESFVVAQTTCRGPVDGYNG